MSGSVSGLQGVLSGEQQEKVSALEVFKYDWDNMRPDLLMFSDSHSFWVSKQTISTDVQRPQ